MALSNNEYLGAAENLAGRFGEELERTRPQVAQQSWCDTGVFEKDGRAPLTDSLHVPLDTRQAGLDDLADKLISGSELDLFAIEPVQVASSGPWGLANRETVACILGVLGRALPRPDAEATTVIPITEMRERHEDYAVAMRGLLGCRGINADSVKFRQAESTDQLIERLSDTPYGSVVHSRGNVSFRPDPALLEGAHHTWVAEPDKSLPVRYRNGELAPGALLASELAEKPASAERIVLAPIHLPDNKVSWTANTLLRALGITKPTNHHTIRYNLGSPTDVTTHAFTKAFHDELLACLKFREHYRDSGTEPGWVDDYVRRNYGEEAVGKSKWDILPEDVGLIDFLVRKLPDLIPPKSINSYRNIGSGPYSYLNTLLQPFMAPSGVMRAQDKSAEAREFAEAYKSDTIPAEFAQLGLKFERLMVAAGGLASGHLWAESDARTRKMLSVEPGDLYALEGEHEVEADCFVSYATARTKSDYWNSIRRRAEHALEWVITFDIHKTKAWGEESEFSAVYLDEDDPPQAHRDAGLEVVGYFVTSDKIKARSGYSAMSVTVARKRR